MWCTFHQPMARGSTDLRSMTFSHFRYRSQERGFRAGPLTPIIRLRKLRLFTACAKSYTAPRSAEHHPSVAYSWQLHNYSWFCVHYDDCVLFHFSFQGCSAIHSPVHDKMSTVSCRQMCVTNSIFFGLPAYWLRDPPGG